MGRADDSDDLRAALKFVERLRTLPESFRRPALPPLLNVDPYLSAWTNVEAAMGNAPARERELRLIAAAELEGELGRADTRGEGRSPGDRPPSAKNSYSTGPATSGASYI